MASELIIDPGYIYLGVDNVNRPGETKIGKAVKPQRRLAAGRTWLSGLSLHAEVFFLNAKNADAQAKAELSAYEHNGEWFRLGADVAHAHLLSMQAKEVTAMAAFKQAVGMAQEAGMLTPIAGGSNAALERIMQTLVPRYKGATVMDLFQTSLGLNATARSAASALEKMGVYPIASEGVAVLELRAGSKLASMLDKSPAANTWRAMLSNIAGFDRDANQVMLVNWSKNTSMPSTLKRIVNDR